MADIHVNVPHAVTARVQEAHITLLHVICELGAKRASPVAPTMPELRTETMTVNMGPQHPSTHGVFRLVLELDGEVVVSAQATIGYLHTGIEKTAENKKWQQVVPLIERTDYLGAQSNSLAYALSVEKLLGLEMPDRVKWIRVLLAELQRINSHLVWLGTHAMDLGAVSVMLYCFRERELILNINELIAGFRLFPELHPDRRAARGPAARASTSRCASCWIGCRSSCASTRTCSPATRSSPGARRAWASSRWSSASSYALMGPMSRAAGSTFDVRKVHPYSGYETFEFDVPQVRGRRRVRSLPDPAGRDASEHPHLQSGPRAHHADRRLARRGPAASRRRPRTRSTPRWKR